MKNKIALIHDQIASYEAVDTVSLEAFRIEFLGSKSVIKTLFNELKMVAPEEKKRCWKTSKWLACFC